MLLEINQQSADVIHNIGATATDSPAPGQRLRSLPFSQEFVEAFGCSVGCVHRARALLLFADSRRSRRQLSPQRGTSVPSAVTCYGRLCARPSFLHCFLAVHSGICFQYSASTSRPIKTGTTVAGFTPWLSCVVHILIGVPLIRQPVSAVWTSPIRREGLRTRIIRGSASLFAISAWSLALTPRAAPRCRCRHRLPPTLLRRSSRLRYHRSNQRHRPASLIGCSRRRHHRFSRAYVFNSPPSRRASAPAPGPSPRPDCRFGLLCCHRKVLCPLIHRQR